MEEIEAVEAEKEKRPGVLSVINLSVDEREFFLDYMESVNPQMNASYIFALLGDEKFLKFFDVMSNTTIKVPSRDSILKIINYIKIYNYCKKKNFSKEGYEKAARIYGRRAMSIMRIVEKVERILEKNKVDLDDDE